MPGLETIIKTIRDDAAAEAQLVLDHARGQAARILAEAKAVSDAECKRIIEEGRRQAELILARAEADAAMEKRRALLEKKLDLLSQTIQAAREAVLCLPEDQYFDLLIRFIARSAEQSAGVMFLSRQDLNRLPSGFETALRRVLPDGASITISPVARPIDGGFILQYGEIDQNCSLMAIFDENRERILDTAQEALFQ